MDEMRVKLTTKFMRKMVSKLIVKMVYKQTGCKIDIQLDELDVWAIDGNTTLKVSGEVKLNKEEFNKIIESISND